MAYERSHNSYEKPMRTQCLSRAKSPRKLQTNSIKITATEARDEKWTCMGRALSMADQWGARILSTFVHFCPLLSTFVQFGALARRQIGWPKSVCLECVYFQLGALAALPLWGEFFSCQNLPKSARICPPKKLTIWHHWATMSCGEQQGPAEERLGPCFEASF